jgi:hypothetical protein
MLSKPYIELYIWTDKKDPSRSKKKDSGDGDDRPFPYPPRMPMPPHFEFQKFALSDRRIN